MFETQANVLHLLAPQRQPSDIKIPDYHQLRTSVTQELWQAVLCDPVLAPLMQGGFSSNKPYTNTVSHNQHGTNSVTMYFTLPRKSEFLAHCGFPT